jgi:hypothetical protein
MSLELIRSKTKVRQDNKSQQELGVDEEPASEGTDRSILGKDNHKWTTTNYLTCLTA